MSDKYESNESEDMSSFFQVFLQNSSSLPAADSKIGVGGFLCGAGAPTESSTAFSLSDPNYNFAGEYDRMNPFSGVNHREVLEAYEVSLDPGPQRSSKRNRDTEVHNLCEKRRRGRINEKIKALQTLIPNSNKTDKASMLDEAIEYLKQLQLQFQRLTTRTGLSLLPNYSVGSLQSTLTPSAGVYLDDENASLNTNTNIGTNTLCQDPNGYMHSFLMPTNHHTSTLPMLKPMQSFHVPTNHQISTLPTKTTNSNSGTLPGFVQLMENRCGLPNHLASSKDIFRDDTLSRLQLDISRTGNTSSPGLSL